MCMSMYLTLSAQKGSPLSIPMTSAPRVERVDDLVVDSQGLDPPTEKWLQAAREAADTDGIRENAYAERLAATPWMRAWSRTRGSARSWVAFQTRARFSTRARCRSGCAPSSQKRFIWRLRRRQGKRQRNPRRTPLHAAYRTPDP